MKTTFGLIVGLLAATLLLIAGCSSKVSEPKPLPVSGEAILDSTAELDSGLQDVEELNQLDQEAQSDVSFDELNDVDLS